MRAKHRFCRMCVIVPAVGLLGTTPVFGALVLSSPSYAQNFNFLSSSTSPESWVNDQASQSTTGSPGWYWENSALPNSYEVDDGNGPSGKAFSYGTMSAGDRALGGLTTSSGQLVVWAITIQNGLGSEITGLDISFTGEKWRNGTATSDTLTFSYITSPTNIIDPIAGATDMTAGSAVPTGWTPVPSLHFTSADTGDTGPTDGNDASNRVTLMSTIMVNVPIGSYMALRWHDATTPTGSNHGMAIDDLTLNAVTAVPEPSAALFGGLLAGLSCLATLAKWMVGKLRTR